MDDSIGERCFAPRSPSFDEGDSERGSDGCHKREVFSLGVERLLGRGLILFDLDFDV